MTSLRQIESNRRNALRSTGPKSETGKQSSSKNAVRHGLTAETVIEPLEDPEDYKAFEQAVTADYDVETAVERELVLRLASLLWRLRRSTLIETGLLQIQSEVLREHRTPPTQTPSQDCTLVAALQICRSASVVRSLDSCSGDYSINSETVANAAAKPELPVPDPRFEIAQRILRLSNLDKYVFERFGRYEMALWRQVRQTLFTLERLRWRSSARSRRRQSSWQQMTGIPPAPWTQIVDSGEN
jgi:hypothetical protein